MEITKENTRIGFIGLGIMGASMVGHILGAGFQVHIYTRTKNDQARKLMEKGAVWEDSVADLAKKSQLIITMVGYPKDVEEVYLGEAGILENVARGSIVLDMTTSKPDLARKLYEEGKKREISVLDAPVSGGDTGARNAALSIMVGGDEKVFDLVLPLLRLMGKNIVYQGGAGSGQHTKMSNQIAISAGMIAVCEAIAYAKKAGLNPEKVLASISQGAAGSWSLSNLGPRILEQDFAPGFFIKHFIKDMGIALESAKSMGLDTPGLSMTFDMYRKLKEQGLADKGTQALFTHYL